MYQVKASESIDTVPARSARGFRTPAAIRCWRTSGLATRRRRKMLDAYYTLMLI
jgi:hypothetical protein